MILSLRVFFRAGCKPFGVVVACVSQDKNTTALPMFFWVMGKLRDYFDFYRTAFLSRYSIDSTRTKATGDGGRGNNSNPVWGSEDQFYNCDSRRKTGLELFVF